MEWQEEVECEAGLGRLAVYEYPRRARERVGVEWNAVAGCMEASAESQNCTLAGLLTQYIYEVVPCFGALLWPEAIDVVWDRGRFFVLPAGEVGWVVRVV